MAMKDGVGGLTYLAVALGGLLGGLLRLVVLETGPSLEAESVVLLTVNGAGSLLIGLVFAFSEPGRRYQLSPALSAGLMAGFCGALTTFSAFGLMVLGLALGAGPMLAGTYILLSLLVWLLLAGLGLMIGRRINKSDPTHPESEWSH